MRAQRARAPRATLARCASNEKRDEEEYNWQENSFPQRAAGGVIGSAADYGSCGPWFETGRELF